MVSVTVVALASVLSLAFTPVPADHAGSKAATEWVIDASHSKVGFNVRHFFTPVNGSFDAYEADVRFSPDDLANSSISVTIDVKSVNTDNQRRDEHLMSGDFFNAETWGTITFKSSTISSTGDNTFVAKGELTIRDVTRTIDLPFTLLGVMDHPWQAGKKVAGITASTKLNRNDYGVGTGDWAATAVIGDEVIVNIDLELNTK
jgi:polyisoprenoid-binding protein YceI